ncbi:hypothetical protein MHYP_G00355380 [Metynnis hypsauchen]
MNILSVVTAGIIVTVLAVDIAEGLGFGPCSSFWITNKCRKFKQWAEPIRVALLITSAFHLLISFLTSVVGCKAICFTESVVTAVIVTPCQATCSTVVNPFQTHSGQQVTTSPLRMSSATVMANYPRTDLVTHGIQPATTGQNGAVVVPGVLTQAPSWRFHRSESKLLGNSFGQLQMITFALLGVSVFQLLISITTSAFGCKAACSTEPVVTAVSVTPSQAASFTVVSASQALSAQQNVFYITNPNTNLNNPLTEDPPVYSAFTHKAND